MSPHDSIQWAACAAAAKSVLRSHPPRPLPADGLVYFVLDASFLRGVAFSSLEEALSYWWRHGEPGALVGRSDGLQITKPRALA